MNVPIYNNLDVLSNVNAVYPADHLKKSICQYFAPCELCSESINQDDLEKHKVLSWNNNQSFLLFDICRILVLSDVLQNHLSSNYVIRNFSDFDQRFLSRSIVPFPLLELTSCPFCDNIIPFNMLRIHQVNIEDRLLICLDWVFYLKYTCSKTAPWPNECQNLIRSPVQDSCT